MLLTIATTHVPATDLGYLLFKNPARVQSFELSHGKATVFYPEATENRCEVALLIDIDPIALVRREKNNDNRPLQQYVNDRPYVASSFLSVAIGQVFRTALNGKCEEKPGLAEQAIPLEATIAVLPCRESPKFLVDLFEPLGYDVEAIRHEVDSKFSEWGQSPYYTVTLRGTQRLCDLLAHLYVLIPVLDFKKHYFVDQNELEKLLRRGENWLPSHPMKEKIASRYLIHDRSLLDEAIARVTDEVQDPQELDEQQERDEKSLERRINLNETRMQAVVETVRELGAKSVVDMGCGEGKLLQYLWKESTLQKILGIDVSYRSLELAQKRLHMDGLHDKQKERLQVMQSSLTYRDQRLEGFDTATCIEVIEHLDTFRLDAFARVLFQFARPKSIILTTPNREYNVKFSGLPVGQMRHKDHRFEWTRAEFRNWAENAAQRFGYSVLYKSVGEVDDLLGPPTQMAVFTR